MFPTLFHIGPVVIHAYGFFFALAYLACSFVAQKLASQDGLPSKYFLSLCFISLMVGLVGSRMHFVWTQREYFTTHPEDILRLWQGGMVFYGGFFLAIVADVVYISWRKLPLLRSLDILAISLAVAQAIGRIGCLGAGCCHGSICEMPWAIRLDTPLVEAELRGISIHPTQIYESVGASLLAFVLYKIWKQRPGAGITMAAYCLAYASLRFCIELFRGDSVRGFVWGGLFSTSQAIALVVVPLSLALLFTFTRKRGLLPK